MSIQIRPFSGSDDDYQRAVALRNAVNPDLPSTVAIWRHWDRVLTAERQVHRLVAEDEQGQLLGYAEIGETSSRRGKFNLVLNMLPAAWHDAAQPLFAEVLTEASRCGARALVIEARESEREKLHFLIGHGFRSVMRSPISYLDVASFDDKPFAAALARVEASGIRIVQPPAGWHQQPYWSRLVFELDWRLLQDVAHFEERPQPDFHAFVKEEFDHPNFLPGAYFIAFDGDLPVGMSNFVMRGGTPERLAISVTGVIASHRRRGIATALKVASIRYAQSVGARIIITDNEEHNPMYALNQRLGFRPQPAWLDLELILPAAGQRAPDTDWTSIKGSR